MRRIRIFIWILAALALAGFVFLLLRTPQSSAPGPSVAERSFGGPFTLIGADGQPFASSRLNGRPYAVFFGFTHCPDVCPTTLARLVKLRDELGRGDDAFNIVFISVDPERDGPKEVGAYADAFGGPVIGLTGSSAQIEQVKSQYGIYSRRVPVEGGDYTVDHTATVLLFDRNGKFASTISTGEGDDAALDKLKQLTA